MNNDMKFLYIMLHFTDLDCCVLLEGIQIHTTKYIVDKR